MLDQAVKTFKLLATSTARDRGARPATHRGLAAEDVVPVVFPLATFSSCGKTLGTADNAEHPVAMHEGQT